MIPTIKKVHRTTVYLATEDHRLVEQEGLNLSEFVRDKLQEEFSKSENLESRKEELNQNLEKLKFEQETNQKEINYTLLQIEKIDKKLVENERLKQNVEKLKDMPEREAKFLMNIVTEYPKEDIPISKLREWKENFGSDKKSDEFYEKIKKVRDALKEQ